MNTSEFDADLSGTYAQRGARAIYYESIGSGRPVVLCHGNPGGVKVWGDLDATLARRYAVTRYDRYGYGRSATVTPDGDDLLDEHAEDLRAVLDAAKLQKPLIVGWSLGGAIAQAMTMKYPGRAAGLVLLATLGPGYQPPAIGLLEKLARDPYGFQLVWQALRIPAVARQLVRSGLRDGFYPEPVAERWVDDFLSVYSDPRTVRNIVIENAALASISLAHLHSTVPTLLVHGVEDRFVPVSVSRAVARATPHAELVETHGLGHMLPMSAPELVADHIARFFEKISATSAGTRSDDPSFHTDTTGVTQ
jgi:3-oxoadipate enol-lactonase